MIDGVRLLFEALRLLVRERRLWPLAAAPVLIAIAAVAATAVLLFEYAAPLHALLTGWLPHLDAGAWYTWIWIGPAKLLVGLFAVVLDLLAAVLAITFAFLLANVVAAPFLDALSRRVEALIAGTVVDAGDSGLRAVWNEGRSAVAAELQRLVFFTLIGLGISVLGVVVPGGQVVAPPLLFVVTALFLPLQYGGYALDRRRVPFAERRRWVLAHWPQMFAFGGTAFLTFLVPGLNFLMIPTLVVGGTLLVVRHPPA